MTPALSFNCVPLLRALIQEGANFVVIGGVAGNLLGNPRVTLDLDVLYQRERENYRRIVRAISPFNPTLRGAPKGIPFIFDDETIARGLNFTFDTSVGDFDLLGDVAGGGTYDLILPDTVEVAVEELVFRCVNLPRLIALKRAAGRPKDHPAIAELEVLLSLQNRTPPEPR